MTPTENAHIAQSLERLQNDPVLAQIETRLATQNGFNLFDAIGVSKQELRHSDFLAFLMRPHEAHGLGDAFLKWFIGHALIHSPAPPVAPTKLASWDLSDALVEREPDKIDLLIKSDSNRLAIIIENKIKTGEHSDQLSRYMETAKAQGHGGLGDTLLGVYLTPHGNKSSHADYLPIGYEAVCAHLEKLCETNAFADAKSPDVETTVCHYTRMLRSQKIVGNPELSELCRTLYAKHKAAFDQIFTEVRNPTEQKNVAATFDDILKNTPVFVRILSTHLRGISFTHFAPRNWMDEAGLIWKNQRSIYIQAETYPSGKVDITGMIAPCAPDLRQKLINLVRKTAWFGKITEDSTDKRWVFFYRYTLVESFAGGDLSDAWADWVENEGPKFASLIKPGDFP